MTTELGATFRPEGNGLKVIIFGAGGMVGQGVLRECLLASDVTEVVLVGRTALEQSHTRLRQVVTDDVSNLEPHSDALRGVDACFFCLGVSSAGMDEAAYSRVTHDLTLAAASTLARLSPDMSFVYVSGGGTDTTEKGRSMWARVKGRTENDLLALPFAGVCLFRPGVIQPMDGIVSKTGSYRVFYRLLGPVLTLARHVFPRHVLSTRIVGRAMLEAVRSRASGVFESPDIARLARAERQTA